MTLLGLLDLSAAFDTVDHDVLLRGLATSFEISRLTLTLTWLSSFFIGKAGCGISWRDISLLICDIDLQCIRRLRSRTTVSPLGDMSSELRLGCERSSAIIRLYCVIRRCQLLA